MNLNKIEAFASFILVIQNNQQQQTKQETNLYLYMPSQMNKWLYISRTTFIKPLSLIISIIY